MISLLSGISKEKRNGLLLYVALILLKRQVQGVKRGAVVAVEAFSALLLGCFYSRPIFSMVLNTAISISSNHCSMALIFYFKWFAHVLYNFV